MATVTKHETLPGLIKNDNPKVNHGFSAIFDILPPIQVGDGFEDAIMGSGVKVRSRDGMMIALPAHIVHITNSEDRTILGVSIETYYAEHAEAAFAVVKDRLARVASPRDTILTAGMIIRNLIEANTQQQFTALEQVRS